MQLFDDSAVCLPLTAIKQCEQASFVRSADLVLRCDQCEKSSLARQLAQPQQSCQKYFVDPNCAEMLPQTVGYGKTPLCGRCELGFTLSSDKRRCSRLPPAIPSCARTDEGMERCLLCQEGFFSYNDATLCARNPKGITGCVVYKDKYSCLWCQSNFYVRNGTCVELLAKDKVPNCRTYDESMKCVECFRNYFLADDSCS